MKALLGFTATIVAASVNAAQPQPDLATSEPSTEAEQSNDIVVEGPRLAEELKNTSLTMVRGRNNWVTVKIRADGTYTSTQNGLQGDFGNWRVERDTVCFDGRMRGTICIPTLFGRRPGDTWVILSPDGRTSDARLTAND